MNLGEKLALFSDHWNPRVVGELNGQHVKLVKFAGEFVWHRHELEDELFLVVRGSLALHFRDRVVELAEGEFCIVPRGVEHKPVGGARGGGAPVRAGGDLEHGQRARGAHARGARADLA